MNRRQKLQAGNALFVSTVVIVIMRDKFVEAWRPASDRWSCLPWV